MEARQFQKLKIIYIADILNRYSDDEHPLSAADIIEKLADYGISAERKAIYDDIEMLCQYGLDIVKTRSPKIGYFIGERNLELPEIYLLTDAVRSANFITPKKTRELISKLDNMLSVSQAQRRDKGIYIDSLHKCKNEEIYYNIDTLNEAILKGIKITLKYCTRTLGEGKQVQTVEKNMEISPYALLWENDYYYLVGNNAKYDNLIHLRLDRIRQVKLTDKPYRHFSEVSSYREVFDVADYISKTFNMYGGESKTVEFRCKKSRLEQIVDRFSENIMIYHVTEDSFSFSVEALISDGLISWLLQFGSDIEVLSPAELRDSIKEKIKKLGETYVV